MLRYFTLSSHSRLHRPSGAIAFVIGIALAGVPIAAAHGIDASVPGAARLLATTRLQVEGAPQEVHGSCVTTEFVSQLGDVCATRTGLFRIKLRDGSTITTHGFDGPQA